MTITLRELVAAAERTAERQRRELSPAVTQARLQELGLAGRAPGRFAAALRGAGLSVIAEVKGASPVDGVLRAGLDPVSLARTYEEAGAAAISVLTEERHFAGSLDHLEKVAAAVGLPLLRKDFIVQEYQVARAALAGAAAVLLIAEALEPARLEALVECAHGLGLDALVEIHGIGSLDAAIAAGSGLIGVNNRDLTTMVVDPGHALRVAEHLPAEVVKVAESGLASADDAAAARAAGYDAVLVGSALVRAGDPAVALRTLCAGRC